MYIKTNNHKHVVSFYYFISKHSFYLDVNRKLITKAKIFKLCEKKLELAKKINREKIIQGSNGDAESAIIFEIKEMDLHH